MYRIIVTVTPERDLAARLSLAQGSRTLYEDWAAASADPKCAARLGNSSLDPLRPGGHPPLGRYELVARGAPPNGTESEYGRTLLLFEPVGGQALDAEAYGRLALLVYAGRMAPDSRLRRTQGGLRLSATAMDFLLAGLDEESPVELRIEINEPRPWWAFWRKSHVHPPLSGRAPEHTMAPTDEATLTAELMKQARRRHAASQRTDDDDHERRRERDDRSSSDSAPEYRGRGGEGGGAGASGEWSDAPAAGRGPGVDSAGRIVTAAGIAAVATAAAMTAREAATASEAQPTSTNNETATSGTDTSASESTSSGSDSNWSSSSTSY